MIVCSLVLILGIGTVTFSYVNFYEKLENNLIHSTESNLTFLADNINQELENIYDYAKWCQQNTDIINYVKLSPSAQSYARYTTLAKERLDEEYLYNPSKSYMLRVVVANESRDDFLQYTSSYYSASQPMTDLITELPYYKDALEGRCCDLSCGLQRSPVGRTATYSFPLIRPIYNPYGTNAIGFVYIEISPQLFSDSISEYAALEDSQPVYLTVSGTNYRIDADGLTGIASDYTVHDDKTQQLSSQDNQYLQVEADGKLSSFVSIPLGTPDCYLSQQIPAKLFHQQTQSYLLLIFGILLVLLLLGIFLYFLLSRIVNRPVASLNSRLSRIAQGDFTRDDTIEWENELGDIGRSINKLSADIQDLMNKRIEDEKQKKDYEYKMLQSQINPHFLYNTLNSIKWMATIQNAPGIAEMVTSLSRLLKSIAKGTSTIVTIQDEFQLLNDYFLIQKYRYGGAIRLEYRIDDEELVNNQILRFTLQPIVENAIFHGIEPKGCEGLITLHLYRKDGGLVCIDITDNGIGMTPDLIDKILSEDEPDKSHFFRDVGISSVHKRLQYTFGESCGLSIRSVPGDYTTMTITLKNTLEKGSL